MCFFTSKFLGKEKNEHTFWARASSRSSSWLSPSRARSCSGSDLTGVGVLAAGVGAGDGEGVLGIISISFSASECQIRSILPCVTGRR